MKIVYSLFFVLLSCVSINVSAGISIEKVNENLNYLDNSALHFIVNPSNLLLNRQASIVTNPEKEFNIPDKHTPIAYTWDSNDISTENWYPQGITGNDEREYNSADLLLMSWYGKGEGYDFKGSRISFVNMNSNSDDYLKYRHVLLVQNKNNIEEYSNNYQQLSNFAPVPVHAGGISWLGHYLYVADTHNGIRIFDLNKIFKTEPDESKNKCGIEKGKAYAFDYRYALPQVAYYNIKYSDEYGGYNPFSCISLERRNNELFFWTGTVY